MAIKKKVTKDTVPKVQVIDGVEKKLCPQCGCVLPVSQFRHLVHHKTKVYGPLIYCKECERMLAREASYLRQYDISIEEYDRMFLAQDGKCAICRGVNPSGRRLAVDHDHNTNKVRALLCTKCNTALGGFNDDPDLLKAAAHYLNIFS